MAVAFNWDSTCSVSVRKMKNQHPCVTERYGISGTMTISLDKTIGATYF